MIPINPYKKITTNNGIPNLNYPQLVDFSQVDPGLERDTHYTEDGSTFDSMIWLLNRKWKKLATCISTISELLGKNRC